MDDLRTMALAESGALQLKTRAHRSGSFIQEIVSGFESQAKEKEIKLELSLADMEAMNIDPQRVREVLTNLLSNALRYTPHGGDSQ